MKAILEFNLPEDQDDHNYALSGIDALLVIHDLENEIRSKLRYDAGEFKEFDIDLYHDDGSVENRRVKGCDETLEKVWEVLLRFKQERNLPELT
jgi:hypothetical protein